MLQEELELEIDLKKEAMDDVISSFQHELNKVRTGRANPLMISSILVDYYGTLTPINQIAAINVVEGRQLVIKPYDRNAIKQMIAGITKANLPISLQDQGDYIRIIVPPLTEETRREYVKQVKKISEEMRVRIRNLRRTLNDTVKKSKIPEDNIKLLHDDIQKITDDYISKIDNIAKLKEQDLMTV